MPEELGHEISEKTIELALQHLAEAVKHTSQVEKQGQGIKGQGELDIQVRELIKKHSQNMQKHLVAAQELANKLEQTKSSKVYTQMNSEHILAVQDYIKATKEFFKISSSDKSD